MLLDTQTMETRRFVAGLIYCAMLNVYKVESERLNDYWADGGSQQTSYLSNFINLIIANIYVSRKWTGNFSQYHQIVARFASLGPEARLYLLKARMIGRYLHLINSYVDEENEWTDMSDIRYQENEDIEIGFSTEINVEKLSYFEEKYMK